MAYNWFNAWFKFLEKGKYAIIIFWIIMFGISAHWGPQFLQHTKAAMNAPPGSDADISNQKYAEYFPATDELHTLIILVKRLTPGSVLGSYVADATSSLNKTLHEANSAVTSVIGFYTFYGTSIAALGAGFLSKDLTATLIQIKYTKFASQIDLGDFIEDIRDILVPYCNDDYSFGLTGQDALYQDIVDGTASDMERMDLIVLPLALLTLAYVVRSYRLMIIPICSVLISLLTGYLIMLPISTDVYDCSSVCPSVMMSLTIAMSIDYSLFLLTRYREEHERKKPNIDAVRNMEFFGGHIVAMSGGTLAITFIALAFFPMDFLKSVGIGACLALLCTMSVNLTLTPALLLAFGGFFSNFETPWLIKKLCPCCVKESDDSALTASGFKMMSLNNSDEGLVVSPSDAGTLSGNEFLQKIRLQEQSFWFKSALFSTTPKYAIGIIVVVTVVALPFIITLFEMETTIDSNQLIPRDSPAQAIYDDMMASFPPGQLSPYQITLVTPSHYKQGSGGVWNTSFWQMTQALIISLQTRTNGVSNDSVTAISWYGGSPVAEDDAKACVWFNTSGNNCDVYRTVYHNLVADNNNVTYIGINVDFDPTGDDSPQFISDARKVLDDYKRDYPQFEFYFNGGAVNTYDAVNEVHRLFPTQIAGTSAAVFIIVGLLFRSLFVPIRLLLTIALPITWIYGFSVMVFQLGWFNAFSSNLKEINALYWLIPVMCFSILVGLGLDYDIFLFSRVVEYRKLGYNDRAAICKGIYRTGGIITAAGIIMFISFSGLMLSSEMALNQYGFMLAFAVLVDTFIVRTLLVPALMQLAGPINWWPGYMPPATKDNDCQDEEPEDLATEPENGLNERLVGDPNSYPYAVEQ